MHWYLLRFSMIAVVLSGSAPQKIVKETPLQICAQTPAFVFIGNAEQTSLEQPADDLEAVILKDLNNIRRMLNGKEEACAKAGAAKSGPVLLLAITDGPESGDTRISTYRYDRASSSGEWAEVSHLQWEFAQGKLVEGGAASQFEAHLPTQLNDIVSQVLAAEAVRLPSFTVDRTIYLVKTHGARFYDSKTPATLHDYYVAADGGDLAYPEGRAFLFDGHGPAGTRHLADLFQPVMETELACVNINKMELRTEVSQHVCDVCQEYLKEAGSLSDSCRYEAKAPLTAVGSTLSPDMNSTLAPDMNNTLSPDMNSTLAPDMNNTLSPDMNSTLAPDMNNTLSPDMNSTLSPDMNSTLSPDMNSTLSPDMNSTLSPDMNSTLGVAKSFVFTTRPGKEWPNVHQLAAGIGDANISGLSALDLPLVSSAERPALVLVDSCFASADLLSDSFGNATANSAILVFSNGSVDFDAFDYSAYTYVEYLTLTQAMVDRKTNARTAARFQVYREDRNF